MIKVIKVPLIKATVVNAKAALINGKTQATVVKALMIKIKALIKAKAGRAQATAMLISAARGLRVPLKLIRARKHALMPLKLIQAIKHMLMLMLLLDPDRSLRCRRLHHLPRRPRHTRYM